MLVEFRVKNFRSLRDEQDVLLEREPFFGLSIDT
jgi:AAA15 family ATPase/GTPase